MAKLIPTTFLVLLVLAFLLDLSSGQSVSTNRSYVLKGNNFTIDCGGSGAFGGIRRSPFSGSAYLWLVGFNDGNTKSWSVLKNGSHPRPIRGAPSNEWLVYRTNRFAVSGFKKKWGYRFPVSNPGLYSCSAQFAELYPPVKAGERVFDLEINAERGSKSFKSIDVKAAVADFTALTKTAPALAVTRYIEILVQTKRNSKHGAIINGISCRRTGNLPADVPTFEQPKVDRRKFSIVPVIRPNRTTYRDVNGSEIKLGFGYIPTDRFGASYCPGDPYGFRQKTFDSGVFFITNESLNTFYAGLTWPNRRTCFSIIGSSSMDEDQVLRTTEELGPERSAPNIYIPVTQSGMWQCDLLFAEIDWRVKTSGIRVFDVQVQDQLLPSYDILEFTLNGSYTKHALTFFDVPVDYVLSIRLSPIQGKKRPAINALSCSLKKPMSRGAVANLLTERQLVAGNNVQRPGGSGLFINAGGPKLIGVSGEPHGWILGGLDKSDPLKLTDERAMRLPRIRELPDIYLTSRVGKHWYRGKWGYRVPVQRPGAYVIEFHFAELLADIREGDRVFNIQVLAGNRSYILSDLDVFYYASYLSPHVIPIGPINVYKYIHVYIQKAPSSKYGGFVSAFRVYQPVS